MSLIPTSLTDKMFSFEDFFKGPVVLLHWLSAASCELSHTGIIVYCLFIIIRVYPHKAIVSIF